MLSTPGKALSFRRLTVLFVVGVVIWLPSYFAYDYAVATWVADGG
ncbi:MAG: hypothetical protein AB8G17_01300 [Gammaproteobacteria bacterium]